MAVVRVNKTSDFTVMSNTHFKEREMSLKAKGLLSLMLSLPDEWDYSIAGLAVICKENEASIKTTLSELKKFGYLDIAKKFPHETSSGRIEYEYNIFEHPRKQAVEKQEVENQGVEIQAVEKQEVENQPQLNTNTLNTNSIKKECIKDEEDKAAPDYIDQNDILLPMKGLMLSDNQIDDLLDKMGLDAFEEYRARLASYIEETGHRVKSHYATMLKWYNEDRQIAN